MLTKTMKFHRNDWDLRLPKEHWNYRTTWKKTIGFNSYELVYGKNAVFLIEFETKTLRTTLELGLDLTKA